MAIILASASPRRKECLQRLIKDFLIIAPECDESFDERMSPKNVVKYLSKIKAQEIAKDHKKDIVIGSDTIVVLKRKIYGKPTDNQDAFNILKSLSGKTHSVYTGTTIINNGKIKSFYVRVKITFKNLSDQEIKTYINTKEPLDKAGVYGIQGEGGKFVSKIKGDFDSVVGLSVKAIEKYFHKNGIL